MSFRESVYDICDDMPWVIAVPMRILFVTGFLLYAAGAIMCYCVQTLYDLVMGNPT